MSDDPLIDRIKALRAMPYKDYLQTEEWQQRRREALSFANNSCQVCNAKGIELHVHHRTYERRGAEMAGDIIVLCKKCHALFHGISETVSTIPKSPKPDMHNPQKNRYRVRILTSEFDVYSFCVAAGYDCLQYDYKSYGQSEKEFISDIQSLRRAEPDLKYAILRCCDNFPIMHDPEIMYLDHKPTTAGVSFLAQEEVIQAINDFAGGRQRCLIA